MGAVHSDVHVGKCLEELVSRQRLRSRAFYVGSLQL